MRKAYQSDLSDTEWTFLEPHLPAPKDTGRPKTHSVREILDAIFYIVRGGCAWRLLPHDFPTAGRPSTTTSAPGAWMGRGRGCIQPYANGCEFASTGTLSLAQPSWIASR
jgi:transposase